MPMWRSEKSNGPRPLCKECGLREVLSGDLCDSCGPRLRAQKKVAMLRLKVAHEIADGLYKRDAEKYKGVYSFINKAVKQKKSLLLVLNAVRALERQVDAGHPPKGVGCFDYLMGTLGRLEEKSQANKIRQSGATLKEMLGPVLDRMKRTPSNLPLDSREDPLFISPLVRGRQRGGKGAR